MKIYQNIFLPGMNCQGDCDCQEEYKSGYTAGYQSGYTDGYDAECSGCSGCSQEELDEAYDEGYESGSTDGYNSGYTAGSEQTYPIAFNEGYESGYTDGYAIGEGEGFNDGYLSGNTDGKEEGYASGYTNGYADGVESVICSGYTEEDLINAYNSGLSIGYNSGWSAGYESGFTDGCYECGDDYSKDYLTFEALSGGTLYWHTSSLSNPKTIEWSNDSGETWNQVTSNNTGSGSVITTVNAGDKVMFRANWNNSGTQQSHFLTDCPFNAYGNVMSLIDSTNYRSLDTLSSNETFKSLFLNCTNLISAENLILPATSLTYNCYAGMFQNCSSLIAAPELPTETLSVGCYASMFYRCSSLETAPELPAETLYQNSYANMFSYCPNLNYIKCLATDISAIDSTHNWVDGVASAGTFVRSVDMNDWTIGKDGIPTDWVIMPPVPVYSAMPLTFEIISGGTIIWKALSTAYTPTIEYSKNGGNWTSITSSTGDTAPSIEVVEGDILEFRGNNPTYRSGNTVNFFYGSTAEFIAYGNIMSLVDSENFSTLTSFRSGYTFYNLFYGCTGLTDAGDLVLPATTLSPFCYCQMFAGCSNLVEGPELPAETLTLECYERMFDGCTNLSKAPELPASSLNSDCYNGMFAGCTSLTEAPELPATSLAPSCYKYMFSGCTGLVAAPELPATTSNYMACYEAMFYDCTNLNYVKCLTTNISGIACTQNWLYNVSPTGTFVKNASMSSWSTGKDGIPDGWTVQDA